MAPFLDFSYWRRLRLANFKVARSASSWEAGITEYAPNAVNVISLLTLLKFRRRRKQILFVGTLLVFISMQWTCMRSKVQYVEPHLYASEATEVRITREWRYGFIRTYHGARLVRTPNIRLEPLEHPPELEGLSAAMRNELSLVRLKLSLESAFYLLLLIYVFWGGPWIAGWIQGRTSKLSWYLVCVGLLWALGWTIVASPLLLAGYGEPIYSTWAGPGAMSYSGPYFGQPSFGNGVTISYRSFFEVVAPNISAMAITASGLNKHLPNMSATVYLWLLGIGFYGILGVVLNKRLNAASTSQERAICPR